MGHSEDGADRCGCARRGDRRHIRAQVNRGSGKLSAWPVGGRSEEHTSELQSLMRISYAVFCLKKKNSHNAKHTIQLTPQPHTITSPKYTVSYTSQNP